MDKSENILITRQTLLIKVKNQYNEDAWNKFIEYSKNYI